LFVSETKIDIKRKSHTIKEIEHQTKKVITESWTEHVIIYNSRIKSSTPVSVEMYNQQRKIFSVEENLL
jgi:hypothetical protein